MRPLQFPLTAATYANPRRVASLVAVAWLSLSALITTADAQAVIDTNNRSVGGIYTDADGILKDAAVDEQGRLARLRAQGLDPLAAPLADATEMRKVSLRRLEAAVDQALRAGDELPDAVRYLAGLQEIRYVFAYPETNDIVLAGPGEGWKVDDQGTIVGVTTGRPVLLLDDLLVALRIAHGRVRMPISCSIDPTPEGLKRLQSLVRNLRTAGDPRVTAQAMEQALGPQRITIGGVPESSHLARVLVAADYRMKRIAMNLDPSPVAGLPSFLKMVAGRGRGMNSMLPRWWLEPKYEPVLRDQEGLAWQLRGGRVVCKTEQDFLAETGQKRQTGKAGPLAQRWADLMTEHYPELAQAEPIFGQLRNCMELSIVAALIARENLTAKAAWSMPVLLDGERVEAAEFFPPKQVDTIVSPMRKGRSWSFGASGGVMINPWKITEQTEVSSTVAEARPADQPSDPKQWWWN